MEVIRQLFESFGSLFNVLFGGSEFGQATLGLKFLSLVLSSVLVVGIAVLEVKSQLLFFIWRRKLRNFFAPIQFKKTRIQTEWERIIAKLKEDDPQSRRTALLHCENLLSEVLRYMGYYGNNLEELLQHARGTVIANVEDLRKAARIFKILRSRADFPLTLVDAQRVTEEVKKALQEVKAL